MISNKYTRSVKNITEKEVLASGIKKSTLLHILLLALVIGPSALKGCSGAAGSNTSGAQGNNSKSKEDGKIAEKSINDDSIQVTTITLPDSKGNRKKGDRECPSNKFYGGIGIYQGASKNYPGMMEVVQAVPGYPAHEAGVEAEDVILEPKDEDIVGEVGTSVRLKIYRPSTNKALTFDIVRGKICLE